MPHPLLKTHCLKCLTFEEKTEKPCNDKLCLLRAPALHLHGKGRLQGETLKFSNLLLKKTVGADSANYWGVCMEDIVAVKDIFQADLLLYDIDIVD